jgi:hypothetical protein
MDISTELSPVALFEHAHLDLRVRRVEDHMGVMLVIEVSKDAVDGFQMAISWARQLRR